MITLIPSTYVAQQVTRTDMNVASICWGFTLGFGFLTTWEAIRQSLRARDPLRSIYIWMIWMELFVCLAFSIICWIHLDGGIPPRYVIYMPLADLLLILPHSFAFYFCIRKSCEHFSEESNVNLADHKTSDPLGLASSIPFTNHHQSNTCHPGSWLPGSVDEVECCGLDHSCQHLRLLYLDSSTSSDF